LEASRNFITSAFAVVLCLFISTSLRARELHFEIRRVDKSRCLVEGVSQIIETKRWKKYFIIDSSCLSQISSNHISCKINKPKIETKNILVARGTCQEILFETPREIEASVFYREGCYLVGKSKEKIRTRRAPKEHVYLSRSLKFLDEDCNESHKVSCFVIEKRESTPKRLYAYGRCKSIDTN
jgi:hypothetical protein